MGGVRGTAIVLGAGLAAAAGCSSVAVPGPVPPLADEHVGTLPRGRIGLASGAVEGGLQPFYKRWWLDEAIWTDHFLDDVASELSSRGVLVDPRAATQLRVTLRRFGGGRGMWVHRMYATLTVEDASGQLVHSRRYSDAGASVPRALAGLLYQAKAGLLTDPRFLERIGE